MTTDFFNLDPTRMWRPYQPSSSQRWDLRRVAHLYRRAGFGGNRRQLEAGLDQSPSEIVDALLARYRNTDEFDRQMQSLARTVVAGGDPQRLTSWWLYRMIHTQAPLVEQMTLFWHGHFATSAAKVQSARLMYNQHRLLRKHALGRFEEMVLGISRDPAMLIYLDSTTNRKLHPNENYARELMELFCLGLDQYTEKDIQELARCFTGWEVKNEKFRFNQYQHDTGEKQFLDYRGNGGGEEAVRAVLSHPATPRFIARKLVRYFVLDEPSLPDTCIEPLAQQLRKNDFHIEPTVRTIITSEFFFSDHALAAKVRSPVDMAVGLLRSLEGATSTNELANALRPLGQTLFYPPSVKGWDGGRTWINATALLGRANVVRSILQAEQSQFKDGTLTEYMQRYDLDQPEQSVDWLAELLMAVPLGDAVRKPIVKLSIQRDSDRNQQLADVIHAMSTLPEFQLA